MRLSEAIDRYVGVIEATLAPRTVTKYTEFLNKFVSEFGPYFEVGDVTVDHCDDFLGIWRNRAPKTRAGVYTSLNGFFNFCLSRDYIERSPMQKIPYPKVPAPEDRGIKSISFKDVQKTMACCHSWTEKLCLGVLVYMGVRRAAANNLRWKDVDLEEGYIRFREKGGKYIRKPIPKPLFELLVAYRSLSEGRKIALSPLAKPPGNESTSPLPSLSEDDYVIPFEPHSGPRSQNRDSRFIWRVVKSVCERAGVDAHCHAFRAAFAVHYLESYDGDTIGLQNLMGHSQIATTQGYWRRLNKERSMEKVRELDWGVSLTSEPAEGGPWEPRKGPRSDSRSGVGGSLASEGVLLTTADGGASPLSSQGEDIQVLGESEASGSSSAAAVSEGVSLTEGGEGQRSFATADAERVEVTGSGVSGVTPLSVSEDDLELAEVRTIPRDAGQRESLPHAQVSASPGGEAPTQDDSGGEHEDSMSQVSATGSGEERLHGLPSLPSNSSREAVEDDSASHNPDQDSHSDSMTKHKLRGKDSNLDSVKKQKASRSPRVRAREGREESDSMTQKTTLADSEKTC